MSHVLEIFRANSGQFFFWKEGNCLFLLTLLHSGLTMAKGERERERSLGLIGSPLTHSTRPRG